MKHLIVAWLGLALPALAEEQNETIVVTATRARSVRRMRLLPSACFSVRRSSAPSRSMRRCGATSRSRCSADRLAWSQTPGILVRPFAVADDLVYVKVEPALESLHGDPRWAALLKDEPAARLRETEVEMRSQLFKLVLIAAIPVFAASAAPPAIDWEKLNAEATARLAEYVRLDTSNPPGNESRAVEWLKKVFQAEGIPFEAAESAPGRGRIAARLKGAGGEPALVLLSHIDVVPVSREYWTVDAFAAEIRDGYMLGRGTVDTKSLGIAELMALLLLHRNHLPLRRDVIFLATADEEAGGQYGAGWVVKNQPEWIAGAGFLLNEAARARADQSGKPSYFLIGETEKTPAWLKLTAKGRAGHGALPNPDSAVNRLVAALDRLRRYRPALEVTPAVDRALRTQAPYQPEPWRSALRTFALSCRRRALTRSCSGVPRYWHY